MKIAIFVGPTLSVRDARAELEATYLPPVSQGDIIRVSTKKPQVIGIIDGYFERVPAVWHKELLWAMKQGIHIFGAASMGALRAAELHTYGMIGVGWIFEAFRDGLLEDDDEVAIAHGTGETHFAYQSDAMVNIRRTLDAAVDACVLSRTTRDTLETFSKSSYYAERSYESLLQRAATFADKHELATFREWLPTGRVDQKRHDAIQMLRAISQQLPTLSPRAIDFVFEHTESFERARQQAGEMLIAGAATTFTSIDEVHLDAILEELRLDPPLFQKTHEACLLRFLALTEADRRGFSLSDSDLEAASHGFRRRRALFEPAQVKQWCTDNDTDTQGFGRLVVAQELISHVVASIQEVSTDQMLDELRANGSYVPLRDRAAEKRCRLQQAGITNPGLLESHITETQLREWCHTELLGAHAGAAEQLNYRTLGFSTEDDFIRAALREYCYRRILQSPASAGAIS